MTHCLLNVRIFAEATMVGEREFDVECGVMHTAATLPPLPPDRQIGYYCRALIAIFIAMDSLFHAHITYPHIVLCVKRAAENSELIARIQTNVE